MARLGKVLLVLIFILYSLWVHSAIAQSEAGGHQLLLVLMPLLIGVSWVVFRSVNRVWWPLLVLALVAFVAYLIMGKHERIGLVAVSGISHASVNLFLLWFFGHTLYGGREPLISRISRLVQGRLYPEIESYTRNVTLAWSIFFALQILTSGILYLFAPIAVWSFFINVLNLPLLALMFVGEYLYRGLAHPDHPHASIWKSIEVYAKDMAASRESKRS